METPPVRILQRPCQTSVKNSSESLKPPTAVKSLEQREADYAAARRRIMGSDSPIDDVCDPDSMKNPKGATTGETSVGNTVSRQGDTVTNSNVATPLMSIQATPNPINGFRSDFQFTVGTTSCFTAGSGGQPRNAAYNCRQGLTINCAPKSQQQLRSTLSGTRSTHQHQPHYSLTGSTSSPAIFMPSRPAHVPVFPGQVNNTPNAGILPTPPGFNYSLPATPVTDNGVGMHHSHTAASLMQHFGLIQPQYHQPLNGFQHLFSPFSHATTSANPLNFAVPPLFSTNQKHTHQPTFN